MRILISGSSGLIGRNLISDLQKKGDNIIKLKRKSASSSENEISIDYENNKYELQDFENFDAVIHLAGENIVGRWNEKKKYNLVRSRVDTTKLLVDIFSEVKNPPKHFLCASAIGIYGNTGDITINEDSSASSGFLPELTINWEKEAARALDFGARVVNLRIGLVLSKEGGALSKMLLPFKLGLGGNIGDGRQYWSWISIDDIVSSIEFILANEQIRGPVNLVSPEPCTNGYFTKTLAGVLKRPAFFHVPKVVIKLIFGEMGEQALLSGSRVNPEKLLKNNYSFIDTDLRETLKRLLN